MKVDSHFHGLFHSAVTDTLEDGMQHFLNDKGLDAALVQKQNKKLGHKICRTFCPVEEAGNAIGNCENLSDCEYILKS